MRTPSRLSSLMVLSLIPMVSVACGAKTADDAAVGGEGGAGDAASDGGGAADAGAADGGGDGAADGGEGADSEGAAAVDAIQAACTTGEPGEPVRVEAVRFQAEVTWTLTFDEEAVAAGLADCTYTRSYDALQRVDVPHLCPDCDFIVEGTATMTEGLDCYEAIFGATGPTRTETWAIRGVELLRSGAAQARPGVLATLAAPSGDGAPVPVAWESDSEMTVGGMMHLEAAGTVGWAAEPETVLVDPFGPRAEPYACGWECNDPGDLVGVFPLTPGEVSPDFRLADACGEDVSLWDFYGSYLVLDAAQSDCGPCRAMAAESEAFKEELRQDGIPVRLISALGNGLGDVLGTPAPAVLDRWIDTYSLTEPVLADEGWTYALFPEFMESTTGEEMGYPAWVVVGPDMRVISGNVGFSDWSAVGDIIREDWAAR